MFLDGHNEPYLCFDFGYDESGNLNYMCKDGCSGNKSVWQKSGNRLTRTEYTKNTLYKPDQYSYTLDESGKITSFVRNTICLNKTILSSRYTIEYDKVGRLCRIFEENYKTEYGGSEKDLNERYETLFEYREGSCVLRQFVRNKYERTYYSDLYNNTNIDFYNLFKIKTPEDFPETATEWMNNYSFNMFATDGHVRFDYEFDDNENVVRINVDSRYDKCYMKIYYVY